MIRIRELREAKGMQQKELAIDLGVSQPTISDWESGRKIPSARSTQKLANYFNVSIDYLLGRDEKMPTPVSGDGLDPELLALIKRIPADRMPEVERYLRFQVEQGEKL